MPRILVADDDEDLRELLRLMLAKMGHEVILAKNGKEAQALCTEQLPDLVLTDLIMPEREGLETIGSLRQAWPHLKIIAMSGGARMNAGDLLKIAKLMGAKAALAKPFSNQELQKTIETVLAGQ
jgi:CheY-like chemotaxis protein